MGIGIITYEYGKGCGALIKIKKKFNEKDLYPCIEFRAKHYKNGEFLNCEPISIGLIKRQNSDIGIKSL